MTSVFGLNEFISLITLLVLFILIVRVMVNLIVNSITAPIIFKNWDELIKKKYNTLYRSAREGFFASLILVYYFVYLIFYDNKSLINFLEFVQKILNELMVLFVLIVFPLFDIIKNFKRCSTLIFFDRIAEILFILFGLFYLLSRYFGISLYKLNMMMTNVFLLLLISSFIYLSIRFYFSFKDKATKPIDKFFKNI